MKNKLEESWNDFTEKLLATRLPRRRNDKAYFRAGFYAATKLFKESNITPVEADAQKSCRCYKFYKQQNSYSFCPDCGRDLRTT